MSTDKNPDIFIYPDPTLSTDTQTAGNIDLTNVYIGAQGSSSIDILGHLDNSYSYNWSIHPSNTTAGISLDPTADIKLGDLSLKDWMTQVNQRLGIMVPNPKLEQEFEELRKLGDQYKELEKRLTEEMNVWNILKK